MVEKVIIEEKFKEIRECLKNVRYDNNNIGLMGGISGQILFQYHAYNKYDDHADDLIISLEKLYSSIPKTKIGQTYSYGMAGVFDVLNYLNNKNFVDDGYQESEYLLNKTFIDNIVLDIENNNLDFLHGSTGILHYLINSGKKNSSELFLIFLKLYVNKIVRPNVKSSFFPNYNFKTLLPENHANLSLSHGNSAIICVLLKIFLKTSDPNVESLINDIFNTYEIIKNEKNKRIISIYPHSSNDLNESRLAWCYGDLGVASTFWQAGKVFNNKKWKQEALDVMLHASTRLNLKENMVIDAGICHGTAGIAHIFNRFYKETGLKEFNEARWYWLNETLNMAIHKDGAAGYKAWQGEKGWQNEYGLLEGVAGIGLVLLGFLTDDIDDLGWDGCLLLS